MLFVRHQRQEMSDLQEVMQGTQDLQGVRRIGTPQPFRL